MKTLFLICALLFAGFAQATDYGTFVLKKENILSVYDGDTIYFKEPGCLPLICAKIGIRLNTLDTPEIRTTCVAEKEFGIVVRDYLRSRVTAARKIEVRNTTKDKYGRMLGVLYLDGKNVANDMIDLGYARPYYGDARKGWCTESGKLVK